MVYMLLALCRKNPSPGLREAVDFYWLRNNDSHEIFRRACKDARALRVSPVVREK
jgi:hypothetical protein